MKTILPALAIVVGLLPSLACAGGFPFDRDPIIISDPVTDSLSVPVNFDTLNDSIVASDGVYSDDLNDAILGSPGASPSNGRRIALPHSIFLKCAVMGTPKAYPDDLRIRNASAVSLPAGTELKWQVKETGDAGYAVLKRVLRPGQSVRLNGVLDEAVEAGTACSARLL
jgi:hypothetical protein